MIRLIVQLSRLGFLSIPMLWQLYRAKKKHGENTGWMLQLAAARYGDHIALADGNEAYSFAALYEMVSKLGAWLQTEINVPAKTHILFACRNSSPHILWLYAFQLAGIPLVLIHPKTPLKDIQAIRLSYPGALLFSDEQAHETIENRFSLKDCFCLAEKSHRQECRFRRKSYLVFPSSGSTGRPKLIPKKPGAFYWLKSFAGLAIQTGIHKRNAVFISTPVTHGFGYTSLVFALILGKKAVVTEVSDFTSMALLAVKEKTDLLTGVPSSLYQLSKALAGRNHCVSLIISGGAPLNQLILTELSSTLTKQLFSFYGSTESSTSFIAGYKELKQHIHSLGHPLNGISYRVEKESTGGGELWIKSPLSNLSPGEWQPTGDLVEEVKDGGLIWRGRKDKMIIKNGQNIYPLEIENELTQLPGISDALVTGEADPVKGETLLAWVLMEPGYPFEPEQLRLQLRKRLAHIKVPDTIIRVTGFHETATGKKTGVLQVKGS